MPIGRMAGSKTKSLNIPAEAGVGADLHGAAKDVSVEGLTLGIGTSPAKIEPIY